MWFLPPNKHFYYGAPFVSKLCVLLMGQFSTKKPAWYFWKQNIDLIFIRIAKYWVDLLIQKISTQFLCEMQNIGSIFDIKYQADNYLQWRLMNHVDHLVTGDFYQLEIISARSERPIWLQILLWGIDRFRWLLIGVKSTSEM